nr:Dur3 [Starmerella bombicola]
MKIDHDSPPVSQGVGYGIVVGVGLAFALGMILVTFALRRYQKEKVDAAEFATAGRSVNSGLIASAVVSSWTWAATLLVSTTQAYDNGVFGPISYASGAAVQIVLFATVAIELKRKAPGVYTYLEVVKARFGKIAHAIYMFYAVATNILVMAMLIAGASSATEALTGMHPIAACFLIPLGVTLYTLAGGLKATFLTDYAHTLILFVIIFLFAFTVFANNEYLGSPGRVWELVIQAGIDYPRAGNKDGSYLTMKSKSAGIFMAINLAGNFGTVFLDTGYWNKAIAATPAAALPGYFIGGLSWFAIPWLCATTMGLAGRVLEHTEYWPTYPRAMTESEISAGLTLPYTAVAILGRGGGGAALLMIFMAVTSAASAEMVAVSSIWTYDIYRGYINPRATSKQLIWQTHISVVLFVLVMIGFSIGLYYGGVGMGYLYELMGVIICSAVIPISLIMFWSGLNKWSAWLAPPIGMALGIASWAGITAGLYDSTFTLATTGADYPMLGGNLVSIGSPLIIIAICQLIFGHAHYDFEELREFKTVRELPPDEEIADTDESGEATPRDGSKPVDRERIGQANLEARISTVLAHDEQMEKEEAILNKSAKLARIACVVVSLAILIIWPMPMYGTGYIFSKEFFTGWIVVAIIWLFLSMFAVEILPLWQGRYAIAHTIRGIYWDITGQSRKVRDWQDEHPEDMHVAFSPVTSAISGVPVPSPHAPVLVKRD